MPNLYSTDFHLCPDGVTLYLRWSCLEDDHHPARQQAKADYLEHRETCLECTPPVRMETEEDGNATIRE